ncbi:DUF1003 domain-containing protein [uncultured Sphingomonas sp.]|uniref:DUF1003 domain-containing protein n=1 Tax=uncultured Sphingomonas sp. TaxID=158754 RepID=UPI002598D212|nr:DUF1003 domain-containing protein [uncultured Sphingomonas sp.]
MIEPGMTSTLQANIARLTDRAAREKAAAPWPARVADRITAFTGSMTFVLLHLVVYGLWVVANLGWLPAVPRFDPTFVILASEASVEAIFLSTFVLISQNRMADAADRRADLDLHINLLAEHELTRLAGLVARVAAAVGVPIEDPADQEIQRDVAPEQVLDALDARDHSAATAAGRDGA